MPEPTWLRHDLHVVIPAGLLLVLGWAVHQRAGDETRQVAREGVRVAVPVGWLNEPAPAPGGPLVVRADSVTRLEIRREEVASELVSVDATLELVRARRYGELYQRLESGRVEAGGKTWLRTEFAYAFKPTPTHAPRVATAVEYAGPVKGGAVAVVTLSAPEEQIDALEKSVLGTIKEGTP